MKLLTIGSDRNLFKKDSEAQKRIKDYGKIFEEMRIIVFADKNLGYSDMKLSDNVFIYPTNHRYKILYLWNIYRIVKKMSKVNGQMSIVTCQDPFESGLAAWLISRWLKLPLHIQIHTDIFSPYFSVESQLNKLRVLFARFLLPRADKIRIVSERIKQSLIANFSNYQLPITILPVFVDIKKIQNAKIKTDLHKKYPDYDFIILMASRLTKEKNIGMAIEAMAGVIKKLPITNSQLPKNPLLLIVGDGPEKEKLQLLITNYQLQNNIRIESWSEDLISYYKTADLFLLTSNYEGYGRTVVEAMAVGLPVIMTDVGIAGEFLVDGLDGLVVPIGDSDALARPVLEIMRVSEKKDEFRENSLKLVEKLPSKIEYLEKYENSMTMLK